MKLCISALTAFSLFITASVLSQIAPTAFNYQAALRNADGTVMENMNVTIRLSARNGSVNGPINYQETHVVSTGDFGIVNVPFGNGLPVSGSWANLAWTDFHYYLQVEVNSGAGYTDLGTQQLLSVPYALVSDKAQNMTHADLVDTEFQQGPAQEGWVIRYNSDEGKWVPQPFPSVDDGIWSSDATNVWRLSGSIGLGITTPITGLHLHDKGGMKLTKTFTGSTLLDGFYLGQDSFSNGNVYFTNYENADFIFNTNLAERLRITGAGNIGIGTSLPTAPLHLANLNGGGSMFTKWSVLQTGHGTNDGSQIGLNATGQLVIDQKENLDILLNRNGSTKLTINNAGMEVNGTLTSDNIEAGLVESFGAEVVSLVSGVTTTESLTLNSAVGSGNRPVYANALGQLYADNGYASTHCISYSGSSFHCVEDGVYADTDEDWEDGIISLEMEGNWGEAICPLTLPDGAVITKMTGRFIDDMDDQILTLQLLRCSLTSEGGYTEMAQTQSIGAGGYSINSTIDISPSTIDYENYSYILLLGAATMSNPVFGDHVKIISVTIEYSMP
ncbi:MAG: hypothetical protein JNM00_12895 [Flavobacteriales bacterium]|nr:hypothetical protein [Flavobacteriales bacterium]